MMRNIQSHVFEARSKKIYACLWERGAIDALRAEHVSVVDLSELLVDEGFGCTEDHVSRVVDDDIETTVFLDDGLDGRVG